MINSIQNYTLMQSINSLSIAPAVNDWLANSRHPHILHVFDHACNLINERREVLSIVTQQIGNGPFNLVIEDDVMFSEYINVETSISISDNQFTLGDLTLLTTDAKLWHPCPDWEVLHAKRNDILNQLISLPISNYLKRGFDTPFDDHSGLLNHQHFLIAQSQIPNLRFSNSLISALTIADLPSALTAAQKLAGLGQGLTPAGDDFILGAILATWIIHPIEIARVLAKEIANTAAPLTTSLSAAYLKSAGRGEAGILWHNFFDALSAGDSSAIQLQISKLLSIGETSGADTLAGFIGTFISYAESEDKLCHS